MSWIFLHGQNFHHRQRSITKAASTFFFFLNLHIWPLLSFTPYQISALKVLFFVVKVSLFMLLPAFDVIHMLWQGVHGVDYNRLNNIYGAGLSGLYAEKLIFFFFSIISSFIFCFLFLLFSYFLFVVKETFICCH